MSCRHYRGLKCPTFPFAPAVLAELFRISGPMTCAFCLRHAPTRIRQGAATRGSHPFLQKQRPTPEAAVNVLLKTVVCDRCLLSKRCYRLVPVATRILTHMIWIFQAPTHLIMFQPVQI